MSANEIDKVAVTSFVAKHIAKSAKGKVDERQLAEAIDEIEEETQLTGASMIRVHLVDPYWDLATSGFLDRDEETGLLDKIQCEFPEGPGYWWQLAAVELSNNLTQPNVTLVFEDRIVSWLREMRGEKVAPPGTTTRAQFVRTLLDEVHLRDPAKKIIPVIPSLNVVQTVESAKGGQEPIELPTKPGLSSQFEQANKTPGLGSGAAITIKGEKPSSAQISLINEVLAIANELKASQKAMEALIEACIDENDFTNNPGGGGGSTGLLQVIPSTAEAMGIDPLNVKEVVTAFLTKGFASKGGAIAYAQAHPSAPAYEVAQAVQGSGAGEATHGAANYGQFEAEAKAIIAAGGGAFGGGAAGESDAKQLARGSATNPNENSFEAIQRLANQVRWFGFSNGQRFYFMSGYDFERQHPMAYVDVPANTIKHGHSGKTTTGVILEGLISNFDNTTLEYYEQHKKRGRAARKSAIAKPQTPSEIRLPLLCDPREYSAGDVFVIQGSGPLDGRWVVTDTVRKYIQDPYTTLTLEPPEAPYPEPRASSGAASTAANPLGALTRVVEAAKKALSEKSKYQYVYGAGHEANAQLFGPEPRRMDCSAFASLCYKEAGQPDPAGGQYTSATNELIAHMIQTNQPQPGDLAFYGSSTTNTTHVTVYVGNGNVISMGSQGDPSEGPAAQMGPSSFLGYWRPS